jgi:hypothetical protein
MTPKVTFQSSIEIVINTDVQQRVGRSTNLTAHKIFTVCSGNTFGFI